MAKYLVVHGKHRDGSGNQYVPGDTFTAEPYKVENFMDKFKRIDKPSAEEEADLTPTFNFKLEHRGGGKYNVINEGSGSAINDKLLTKEEAETLIKDIKDQGVRVEVEEGEESSEDAEQKETSEEEEGKEEEKAKKKSSRKRKKITG